MSLAALLAEHPHVLLDFDGPVCAVFGGATPAPIVAAELTDHARARGLPLARGVADAGDPFDVLHAAARLGPDAAQVVEHALRDAEVRAIATAPTTTGAQEAITALRRSGHMITVVSNNSEAAIRRFLADHDLTEALPRIYARTKPDPALLKPSPHLLTLAIQAGGIEPAQCVLIGDSTTDVTAARAARAAVIAYANKPGKRDTLTAMHPDAVIDDMTQVARAAARPSVV